ncbi:MAG: CoA-transferase subunit beta [Gammaproteobacteria bacterium]
MTNPSEPAFCTIAEAMIYQLAQTVADGALVFHGYGSPLVQIALHLAKRTHAPHSILVAGATYGVNPSPVFLTPTSNDWAMCSAAECTLDIEELFDLAASGRMGRMFLSGLQIDCWGNLNVTRMGGERMTLKLPGGGGGGNLSCDAQHVTLWTAAHRSETDRHGTRRYRLVERCDFVTSVGHRTQEGRPRTEMPYTGSGPDCLVTELGVFDFDDTGRARLIKHYPDTDAALIREHTGFEFAIADRLAPVDLPDSSMIEFIRTFDPLRIHEREFRGTELDRKFALA